MLNSLWKVFRGCYSLIASSFSWLFVILSTLVYLWSFTHLYSKRKHDFHYFFECASSSSPRFFYEQGALAWEKVAKLYSHIKLQQKLNE